MLQYSHWNGDKSHGNTAGIGLDFVVYPR